MNRSRVLVELIVASAVCALTSCTLRDYDSGIVGCDPADDVSCPAGFACLDPHDLKFNTCVAIGCGDGQLDLNGGEFCDDANANDFDLCVDCRVPTYIAAPRIGLGTGGAAPTKTPIGRPTVVAADKDSNLFIGSIGTNAITRLAVTDNTLTTFAGNGSLVSTGTGQRVPPNEVATVFASSLAVDGLGNVFFSDLQNSVVRRIDAVTGDRTTVIGNGIRSTGEDGVLGTQTSIDLPVGLAIDGNGTVFLAERSTSGLRGDSDRVRRLDRTTGRLTTVIKRSTDDDGGEGEAELVGSPDDIAFDDAGVLYVFTHAAERNHQRLSDTVVERDIFFTITRLRLDADDEIQDAADVEVIDVPVRHESSFDVDPADEVAPVVTVSQVTGCEPSQRAQERIAVTRDGMFVLWASGSSFMRMTLPLPSSSSDVVCQEIGRAPQAVVAGSAFALVPTDVEVFGDDAVFADPGNGVLWRVPVTSNGVSVEPVTPIVPLALDAAFAGVARAAGDDAFKDLVNEIVLDFAKQTDGHLVAALTEVCRSSDVPIDFQSFEFFVSFPNLNRVFLSDCNSAIGVLAGTGTKGFSGDGGLAINAQLARPSAAARGADGRIYIADRDNDRIRRLTEKKAEFENGVETAPAGLIIETFIGEGAVDGGPELSPALRRPSGLAVDDDGRLLVADAEHRVVAIDLDLGTGKVTPLMGTGRPGYNGDGKAPELTQLDEPSSITFLPLRLIPGQGLSKGGLLIVAERGGHRLRAALLTPGINVVYTLAGDGTPGDADSDAEGNGERFVHPRGLMLASPQVGLGALSFFVVDAIDRVRTMTMTFNNFELAATVGTATTRIDGVSGAPSRDDGDAATSLLHSPSALTFIGPDRLVIADRLTGRLRLVTPSTATMRTVTGMPDGLVVTDSPVSAFVAEPLGAPAGIAYDDGVDPAVVYVSESDPPRLRRFILVDPEAPATWTTSVVAVRAAVDDNNNDNTDDAVLVRPAGLGIDVAGRTLYLADQGAHTILAVDLTGLDDNATARATIVAGVRSRRGAAGDGGPATDALLNEPEGVTFINVDGVGGVVMVADTGNNRVRRVDLEAGTIAAVLGDGASTSGGDGAPAKVFSVQAPRGLAVDARGNLIVTSKNALRFVQAGDNGVVDGNAAVGTIYGSGERKVFPEPVTRCLSAVALPPSSSSTQAPVVYAVDACLGVLLRLERQAIE